MHLKRNYFLLLTFFFISFYTSNLFSKDFIPTDSIDSYCNGASIKNDSEGSNIESIDVRVDNNRRWSRSLLKAIVDFNDKKNKSEHKNWFPDFRISENLKKNFNSKVIVKYADGNSCLLNAKIRLTGDLWWHLDWKNGAPISSINVRLLEGHINNITRFKLLLPKSRYGSNEIFSALLLREIGYLSPRTFFVSSKLNGFKTKYIFQEDLRKEFLENLNYREGPILEGDERFTIMLPENKKKPKINLSRISNKQFILKNPNNAIVGLDAVSNLNLMYMQNHQNEQPELDNNENLFIFSKNLIRNENNRNIFDSYESLIFALDAAHHLSFDDRRFYFDSINQNFLPIYYDGKSNILNKNQFIPDEQLKSSVSIEAKRGSKNAIEKIKNINHDIFIKKLNRAGLSFNKSEYELIIKKILKRLKIIESSEPLEIKYSKLRKYISELDSEELKSKKFVFTDFYKKEFYLCDASLSNCDMLRKNTLQYDKYLADVLSQEFNLIKNELKSDKDYIFVFNNIDYDEGEFLNKKNWKQTKIDNFIISSNKHINLKIDKEKRKIFAEQINSNGKILFNGGTIKGWEIEFLGKEVGDKVYSDNYMNLTGCLTFFNSDIENVSVTSKNSPCEDSINFIKTKGLLKNINIVDSSSDGLDLDFSNLSIENINVSNSKNDCLDFSFGKYEVKNAFLDGCGDKAISSGEKSKLVLNEIKVNKSTIGIAAKDSSNVEVNNLQIFDSTLCFAAYRKKQEFSGGNIIVMNTNCNKNKIFRSKGSNINFKS